ncbi:hypothetical protein BKA62DRAFT_668153 [Auriculariales sp. MPI-PUGE-AT-0066]|nr:hypothetical protein BKA62DRAFT_668153 [Auriculariales sp. MPI-PUGE-AT-0066]
MSRSECQCAACKKQEDRKILCKRRGDERPNQSNLQLVDAELSSIQAKLNSLVERRIAAEQRAQNLTSELSLWRAGGTGHVPRYLTGEDTAALLRNLVADCEQHVRRLIQVIQIGHCAAQAAHSKEFGQDTGAHCILFYSASTISDNRAQAFQAVWDAMICSLDSHIMDNPRVMSCGHSACYNCLARHLDENDTGGTPLYRGPSLYNLYRALYRLDKFLHACLTFHGSGSGSLFTFKGGSGGILLLTAVWFTPVASSQEGSCFWYRQGLSLPQHLELQVFSLPKA